ncbi:MAG: dihydropteroate synthase [Candidatus Omnitrophica bacterium]|nr:dihydropteroate synthase [Candidatus Omnitrophota bacterium]
MLIIGERINSTRPRIEEAIKARNAAHILKEASAQLRAGADYIDINCAVTTGDELQDMDWIISVLQSEIPEINICIDSPNYRAIEKALTVYKGKGKIFINSITGEEPRIAKILPMAVKYKTKLIALTMDEKGMPNSAAERVEIAKKIVEHVKKGGFNTEDLYFDALIRPVATEPGQALEFLRAIPAIKGLGNVKTICGLSNVSFGLPHRGTVNAAFLSMAAAAGLDAAILDPTDRHISSAMAASAVLLNEDQYCAGYIKAFRDKRLI